MKIPESIRIGGVEYQIREQETVIRDGDLCYAFISYTGSEILISRHVNLSHEMKCIALWHEILHGIRNHAELQIENEEEVVRVLSRGIYQVLQDNGRRLFDIIEPEKEKPDET